MGNRAYFTIKTKSDSKTYYTHWNGGVDTFAPLAKSLFDHGVTDIEQVILFMTKALELRPELQSHPGATSWLEENGHYAIDLEAKTLRHTSQSGMTVMLHDLHLGFLDYVNTKVIEPARDKVTRLYWDGIQDAARAFYGGAK